MTDEALERSAGPRCPRCHRPASWSGNPARPFCSLRCRLIDLGSWLDGTYRLPGAPLSLPTSPTATPSSDVGLPTDPPHAGD